MMDRPTHTHTQECKIGTELQMDKIKKTEMSKILIPALLLSQRGHRATIRDENRSFSGGQRATMITINPSRGVGKIFHGDWQPF